MPFVRTHLPQDTSAKLQQSIVEGIHQALIDSIGMPSGELFNLVAPYAPGQFWFSRTFNGGARSDALLAIEITMRRGRSDAMKRALYAAIARNLHERAGVAPQDVYIFMHENDYSDWSTGEGQFAMHIVPNPGSAGKAQEPHLCDAEN